MKMARTNSIIWLESATNRDVHLIGGKNAALGELTQAGIRIPAGFATTADAYQDFLATNQLTPQIQSQISAWQQGKQSLDQTGKAIRRLLRHASFPEKLSNDIRQAYRELSERYGAHEVDVAVCSSAIAEDLPNESFAGQQETFLNISGKAELLEACQNCFVSLFTDRAIRDRQEKGFDQMSVALSIGVQKMVRSDLACSGVMFSINTGTGFPDAVLLMDTWGLGETVVQSSVTPAQMIHSHNENKATVAAVDIATDSSVRTLFKPEEMFEPWQLSNFPNQHGEDYTRIKEQGTFGLSDDEILQLMRWAMLIEDHYGCPMDMAWAKDGDTGELFILRVSPETVQWRRRYLPMPLARDGAISRPQNCTRGKPQPCR